MVLFPLAAVLRKTPLAPDRIAFAWRVTVGAAVERATSSELRGGVLHVQTKDASGRREVERSAGVIRVRLQALLGRDVVRTIAVDLE